MIVDVPNLSAKFCCFETIIPIKSLSNCKFCVDISYLHAHLKLNQWK